MKASDYIVNKLITYGVKDTFGVPGGVILKLLYAMDENPDITPHLMTCEQSAGFAACGYAQASGKLGIAYATRGPGITNMVTCMAEAYQESLPVLFFTAHGKRIQSDTRFENNQELEITKMVSDITKYAISIDDIHSLCYEMEKACSIALSGRKGPVLIDFSSSLYDEEIIDNAEHYEACNIIDKADCAVVANRIKKSMAEAERPVLLIGDGIRNAVSEDVLERFASNMAIPIISSRGAQDILMQSEHYYGYIGSHGTRYSNFILSKTDLIVVLGNRLAFPLKSESYEPVIKRAKMIRLDIDDKEFTRKISNAENYNIDAKNFIEYIVNQNIRMTAEQNWIETCDLLKRELEDYDRPLPVKKLIDILESRKDEEKVIVSDVGNNEFYVSRAVEAVHPKGMLLCSKSYGTLGVALGRTIGAYYATHKPVICIMGDQGFQYNTQDLYYIATHQLPIQIVILNNRSSGMISDHEKQIFGDKLVHVNETCDYFVPNIASVSKTYGFDYGDNLQDICKNNKVNWIYEIMYSGNLSLEPNLPKGNECQNMSPLLEDDKYKFLDEL